MGFFSWVPGVGGGGGGGGYKEPPRPELGKWGKWAQSELYDDIERALGGGGLLPSGGFAKMRQAYQKAYPGVERELESQLHRLVPAEDIGVQKYARGMLSRAYAGTQQALKEEEQLRPYEEQKQAIGMGLEAVAGEKRMALEISNLYNQYIQQQAQMPTFGSQLGYGLGSAGGWAAAGMQPVAQRYAQGMANTPQQYQPSTQYGQYGAAFPTGGGF